MVSENTTVAAPGVALAAAQQDSPTNGLAGLKHWRQDMLAGLVVALVSVPLSLGIALSSGAPPICGIMSEIVAGLIFPLLGGAYVTISGPAAGLAPVLYSAITALGRGNMETGYHLVTGVILMAGLLQLLLTWLRAARFSYLFPGAAIQGMLSSIGFMLIAKQVPNFIGHPYKAHEFWSIVMETPAEVIKLQPQVFAISSICLALLFMMPKLRFRWLSMVPPQLVVVVVAVMMGMLWHLDAKFLVSVPANPLAHGIVFPDFHSLFSDVGLVGSIVVAVLTLTFVDGTESLATILAVDKIDPWHRKSSPDRTLFAMGISNICSSLIGGLTIIPGIIKSTTCIVSGGRTAWVNFYNALFLIAFLVGAASVIKMIPLGALAAVLVHIGWKLAGPHKWKQMWSLGSEQMLIYLVTILVTVSTDLLIGILAGILLKFALLVYYNTRATHRLTLDRITALFKSPILATEQADNETVIQLSGPIVCFNSLYLRGACERAFDRKKPIRLQVLSSVNVVDHSTSTFLQSFQQTCERAGLGFKLVGLDTLKSRSDEPAALKYRRVPAPIPVQGTNVLLAVDESEHSRNAIDEVLRTEWAPGSKLVVSTVLTVPFGMSVSDEHAECAQGLIDDVVNLFKSRNIGFEKVEGVIVKGDAKAELYSLLRQKESDLLVVGTRNHRGMARMLVGSVSHALLLSGQCSVRICRARKRTAPVRKVMIALDSTKFSLRALEEVARRPWAQGTEFLCVSAIPTLAECSFAVPDTYGIDTLERNRRAQVIEAQKMLAEAIDFLGKEVQGCKVKSRIINGDPRDSLVRAAEEEDVDLIVLGSAGKNFAERLVVGSVSEAVAVGAHCTVEVICPSRSAAKRASA